MKGSEKHIREFSKAVLCILLFVVSLFPTVYPPTVFGADTGEMTSKEAYELQEQCGKSATRFFEERTGSVKADVGDFHRTYRSHYNGRLNKCFILIRSIAKDKEGSEYGMMIGLFDVHENIIYGFFRKAYDKIDECVMQDRKCTSEREWSVLAGPFMEE